jgi:hypothetical protein
MNINDIGVGMQMSLAMQVPGLGKQFFINPAHVGASKPGMNKASDYLPCIGDEVYVPTACVDARGGAEKYIPGLGTRFMIDPSWVK